MAYAVLEVDGYGSPFLLDVFDVFFQLDVDCQAFYRMIIFEQILKFGMNFCISLVYSCFGLYSCSSYLVIRFPANLSNQGLVVAVCLYSEI